MKKVRNEDESVSFKGSKAIYDVRVGSSAEW